MKFFHNGTKKSNEIGAGSGCVLLIGFAALIYFFTLLDDVEDLKEYAFEIILVSVMGVSMLFTVFRKKGDLSNRHISIEKDHLTMDDIRVPLANVHLDIYTRDGNFRRYHLRDPEGKIALYSIFKDDLYTYLKEQYPAQISYFEELATRQDGPHIRVKSDNRSLSYDLDTGKYTLAISGQPDISFIPEIYTYDGKYKKGEPLKKT